MKARVPLFAAVAVLLAAPAVQAVPVMFTAVLTGPAEEPPNASPGIGFAIVTIDPDALTLDVDVSWSNLLFPTTVAHIHCCTAVPLAGAVGVATTTPTFPGFPAGVFAGNYSNFFDLSLASSFSPTFITNNGGTPVSAALALYTGMVEQRSYFNIHSSGFPGGEIRGFLQPVPEPTTLLLLGGGLGAAALRARRRRP